MLKNNIILMNLKNFKFNLSKKKKKKVLSLYNIFIQFFNLKYKNYKIVGKND